MSEQAEQQQSADALTDATGEQAVTPTETVGEQAVTPPGATGEQPAGATPAGGAGRARRPSSLRAAASSAASADWRKLTPPSFPGSPMFPRAAQTPEQSPRPAASSAGAAPDGSARRVPNPAPLLREKLPLEQLSALIKERPEIGLGLAFAGGLVLATILKRLAR